MNFLKFWRLSAKCTPDQLKWKIYKRDNGWIVVWPLNEHREVFPTFDELLLQWKLMECVK